MGPTPTPEVADFLTDASTRKRGRLLRIRTLFIAPRHNGAWRASLFTTHQPRQGTFLPQVLLRGAGFELLQNLNAGRNLRAFLRQWRETTGDPLWLQRSWPVRAAHGVEST